MATDIPVSIVMSMLLWVTVIATCYNQGPCETGFMDKMEGGPYYANCTVDCIGGPYYANVECECACILSSECTLTTEQSAKTFSSGAIAAIVVAFPLCICFIHRCRRRRQFKAIKLKFDQIPLSVYRHRGHWDMHGADGGDYAHPRNLLDTSFCGDWCNDWNKESWYIGHHPAEGDWIIFKIESSSIIIPKAVIIRTGPHSQNRLTCVELSLATDADDDQFERLTIFKYNSWHISSWGLCGNASGAGKEHYWILKDVLLSDAEIHKNNYKFIKFKVLRSSGGGEFSCNCLHSFSVLGVAQEEPSAVHTT